MERADVVVVGAGVVGLSVAASVAREDLAVLVLERHPSFGRETSSRSSEVIHAGIYYPPGSLKGRLCLEGNRRMYALCREFGIPHANTGKLIVAWTEAQESGLPALLETARTNGAEGVRLVDGAEMRRLEPRVAGRAALYCPTSGIVDSHALMRHFLAVAKERGALPVFGTEVAGLERTPGGWRVTAREKGGGTSSLLARLVVNCAGLQSGEVAALAGIDTDEARYRIHYRKGMYFRVARNTGQLPRMLVYPFPPEEATVGIHTVPDLAGGMRLGPYDVWSETVDYTVDEGLGDLFFEACRPFLPALRREDLLPDQAGIQAKRYGPGEKSLDFVIREESDRGLPCLINLVGIESPGLTASPAIGPYVAGLVAQAL
ncbi:MAG: NAD(P)/FAD-dependent oxidoreductase [Acidobacteriota bacterium]